jgi:uncharacterized protein (DUF1015 family)
MNAAEAREAVRGNPLSFLHVDKAEIDLPPETNPYAPEVYEKAAENLRALVSGGYVCRDAEPSYYIYRLTMAGRSQAGIVACPAADDYLAGHIKKHELTRAAKEEDRVRHITALNANTGPIFLMHRRDSALDDIKRAVMTSSAPVYDFVADGDVRHEVWVIKGAQTIGAIGARMRAVGSLYIADGHHRCASAVRVAQKKREAAAQGAQGAEEFNFFLAVIFDADELQILDYNRVVRDLNGLTAEEFLAQAGKAFTITESDKPVRPDAAHIFGMYLAGKWYRLETKFDVILEAATGPLKSLDVSILQDHLLAPILGVGDPRTDERIDFVGGIRGLAELERRAGTGGDMAVSFSLYPTSTEELMDIADAGLVMPPKSTWFEPKLLSGLFVHEL